MENLKSKDAEPVRKTVNAENTDSLNSDGLSKAEARAKRKEAKKQSKGAKKEPVVTVASETNISVKTDKKSTSKNESTKENENNHGAHKKHNESMPQETKIPKSTVVKVDVTCDMNISIKEKVANNEQMVKQPAEATEMSKAELRAKRRAIQEAQRLAKEMAKANGKKPTAENSTDVKSIIKKDDGKVQDNANSVNKDSIGKSDSRIARKDDKVKSTHQFNERAREVRRYTRRKDSISVVTGRNFDRQVQLFNHLYLHHSASLLKDVSGLHSSIIRLGVQYMSHNILGSNARCIALLAAIKDLVRDYRTPPQLEYCRSLDTKIQASVNYLQKCRPPAASMTNAVRHIKWQLTQIPTHLSDEEKKNKLVEGIETYIKDEIATADKAIIMTVKEKICNGDVILTYGCSSIVLKILLDAHNHGKKFKVVVVDARPLLEGREMLRRLANANLSCSYVLINAASFVMGKVTKVLLGAHSLLANGYVMSRAGTAQVALIAQSFNKPVLVCCETYKFCERVQTDSIVHNEIGDPDKLVSVDSCGEKCSLAEWKDIKHLTLLNLMYDVTPPDLVTAVVTELAILPCTSVPVVLRIKPTELAL